MGLLFSRSGDDPSNLLELAAPELVDFSGHSHDFRRFKIATECALFAMGYERVLTDKNFAHKHKRMNAAVLTLLNSATNKGTASALVHRCMSTQDGHQAWQNMLEWYQSPRRSTGVAGAANAIRTKLNNLYLTEGRSAEDYINKFVMWNYDLELIHDGAEGFSAGAKLQTFLDHIRHPKFTMLVEVALCTPDLTLTIAIERVHWHETELIAANREKRTLGVTDAFPYDHVGDSWNTSLSPRTPPPYNPTPVTSRPRTTKRRRVGRHQHHQAP
jgi:hypothetical protein